MEVNAQEDTDFNEVLEERKGQHGDFIDNAFMAQMFKYAIRAYPHWGDLGPTKQEAMDNILQKVARYIAGDGTHVDSLVDIQGYAQLLIEEHKSAVH